MADWNNDNVNDRWPLFYDNYFVPRGYAYVLAQMNGTGYTEQRLPDARRPDRHRRREVGRRLAQRPRRGLQPRPAVTTRTSRRSSPTGTTARRAMIGKSYDGTLSNGVAATGVEGLKTIVPVSRDLRLVQLLAHAAASATTRTTRAAPEPAASPTSGTRPSGHTGGIDLPSRRTLCAPVNNEINNDANARHRRR